MFSSLLRWRIRGMLECFRGIGLWRMGNWGMFWKGGGWFVWRLNRFRRNGLVWVVLWVGGWRVFCRLFGGGCRLGIKYSYWTVCWDKGSGNGWKRLKQSKFDSQSEIYAKRDGTEKCGVVRHQKAKTQKIQKYTRTKKKQ